MEPVATAVEGGGQKQKQIQTRRGTVTAVENLRVRPVRLFTSPSPAALPCFCVSRASTQSTITAQSHMLVEGSPRTLAVSHGIARGARWPGCWV